MIGAVALAVGQRGFEIKVASERIFDETFPIGFVTFFVSMERYPLRKYYVRNIIHIGLAHKELRKIFCHDSSPCQIMIFFISSGEETSLSAP